MIPEISNERIKKAFHLFDRNYRSGFIYKGNHQYAVLWNNRLYPTKDMIRLAAKGAVDIWYPDFSGSLAKSYFEERGYELVCLPDKQTRQILNLKYSQIFDDSYHIHEIEKNGVSLLYAQNINGVKEIDQIENILRKAEQAWIFQWDQTEYDLFEDYASGKKIEPWRVNAHWKLMKKNDIALLWKMGKGNGSFFGEAGIYAIGRLCEEPYPAPPNDVCKYRVHVEYIEILSSPLNKSMLEENLMLESMVNRVTRGTNFRVDQEEWSELQALILGNNKLKIIIRNGTPPKQSSEILRYIRDTRLVQQIKTQVKNRCQVCGWQLKVGEKSFYSEGHHLRPLGNGHNGPDDEDNIMILCPNHHVEFDCGVIAIDPKTMRIVHSDADNSFHEKNLRYSRELNMKYIEYHWRHIFNNQVM